MEAGPSPHSDHFWGRFAHRCSKEESRRSEDEVFFFFNAPPERHKSSRTSSPRRLASIARTLSQLSARILFRLFSFAACFCPQGRLKPFLFVLFETSGLLKMGLPRGRLRPTGTPSSIRPFLPPLYPWTLLRQAHHLRNRRTPVFFFFWML